MNNKKPGEGLHILWEIIRKGIFYKYKHFRNWLSLPPKCPTHGRQHLFASRTWKNGEEEVSYQCQVKDCLWMSEDWMAKREDYLSDNWK